MQSLGAAPGGAGRRRALKTAPNWGGGGERSHSGTGKRSGSQGGAEPGAERRQPGFGSENRQGERRIGIRTGTGIGERLIGIRDRRNGIGVVKAGSGSRPGSERRDRRAGIGIGVLEVGSGSECWKWDPDPDRVRDPGRDRSAESGIAASLLGSERDPNRDRSAGSGIGTAIGIGAGLERR